MSKLAIHGGRPTVSTAACSLAARYRCRPSGRQRSIGCGNLLGTVLASVIHDAIYPPNDTKFLRQYIEAFQKLWDNLAEVLEVQIGPEEIYLRE